MMNVIIVSKFLKTPMKLSFGNPKVAATAAGLLVAAIACAFGAGYAGGLALAMTFGIAAARSAGWE